MQALLDAGRLKIVARQRNLPDSIVVKPGQRQYQGLKADRFHVLDTHTLAEVVARIH